MPSPAEVKAAIVAMQRASGNIIHTEITNEVPSIFQGQAENMVTNIEAKLYPVCAQAALVAAEHVRAAAQQVPVQPATEDKPNV